ncbi:MAG TPA: adenosylcobinamide-GDP ribazoletransferase [Micromonosporaceae bacterium]|nr:adenosylcobinamide-GDP ribazoletransferase [Micromonosporaceae bacterium]
MADGRFRDGLRLALTTFTVAPVRAGRVDRATAGTAMALAPLIGAALGAVLGTVLLASVPRLLAGVLVVALAALLTRGLHLDGLADTVDALGSYRSREAALDVMRRPDIGPFGVVALVVTLLAQASALSAVPSPVVAVAVAMATGRLAAVWACRRGVPAARPDGLGALVAGTVGAPTLALNTAAVALLAVVAVPGRPWQGPAAVAAALAIALLVTHHAVRRFGGITGDVLGALVEIGTTVALFGLAVTD